MARTLSFQFANKNELNNFCHWDCVIDTVLDSLNEQNNFLVVFCPQPSLLTNMPSQPNRLLSGSHPEEVLHFVSSWPLEKVNFLHRAVPVHLIAAIQEVTPLLSIDLQLRADKFSRRITFVKLPISRLGKRKGDLSGTLRVQSDDVYTFVQCCLPRIMFSALAQASDFLKRIDPLKVAIVRTVGIKTLDP